MIGKTVSHYRILARLGEGGMGVVYRAEDMRLGREVALKFLSPSVSDETAKKRFIREARAASSLDHPNICSIYDIGETDDGRMFIVMPCYEGKTLREIIGQGPMDAAEAISLAIQAASGLSRAHEKGIVHRDIKPGNIFVTGDGLVKIVDFGLAKLSGQTKLTRTGSSPGTAAYMSPEQLTGGDVDGRTDIWALGAVLHEMLTGKAPFEGDYEQAVIYSIVNSEPEPVRKSRPDVHPGLERIIRKMLEKDPEKRFQTLEEILRELEALKDELEAKPGSREPGESPMPSIAVLPFMNMSPDPENRFFGDGLAEELINAFAQIEGLRVASRTSSFRFRGDGLDVREVGEALGVSTLLEGSVRKAGDRLRITAQLINAADGYHIWSKRFDREMADIFDIQDEIARAIVGQLKVKLVGQGKDRIMSFGTENLEAYTALLEGRYHLHSMLPEGWTKGFEMLNRAIELDPGFALPHAWLSMFYQSLAWWGDTAPHDAMPKAGETAARAVELDDDLGFGHINCGVVRFCYDWDFDSAEAEFLRGLELDPGSGYGHMAHSLFYSCTGNSDGAVAEARVALKLEPLDGLIAAWVTSALLGAGAIEEAIDVSLRSLELEQEHWQLRNFLGTSYLLAGRREQAVIEYRKAVELSGGASIALVGLALGCYLTGRAGEGDELTRSLVERYGKTYVAPSLLARLEIIRGNEAAARSYLEQALEARDLMLVTENMWPPEARIRGTKLEPLLTRAGL